MKKVLIVGAGVAGKDVLREIKKSPDLGFKIIGFIDDDVKKQGRRIDGIKVLGKRKDLKGLIKEKTIDEVIIAIPSAQGEDIQKYVKICSDTKIGFRIVPRVKEIIEGKANIQALRKVHVEDILGRPVVKSDVGKLNDFFKGKSVLITGAAGSIGSELSRQVAAYKPRKLILVDWWENGLFELQMDLHRNYPKVDKHFIIANIQEAKRIRKIFTRYEPNYVFHAAAYKHVPIMEDHPSEAVKNNVFGTFNVAKEARRVKVSHFVLVSTDKAANPVSVMGATKLIAEALTKKLTGRTKFVSVRFGNVLGSYGSVVPIFRKQIELGGSVTITDKRMTRYFMTIPEAAQLILKAASIGKGGELFVLDMGKPVKIVDLAENMIRLSGFIPGKDIRIVFTGKRPGEKLHEDLFTKKEEMVSTREKKIYITKSLGIDLGKPTKTLGRLKTLAENGEDKKVRKELKRIVKFFPG